MKKENGIIEGLFWVIGIFGTFITVTGLFGLGFGLWIFVIVSYALYNFAGRVNMTRRKQKKIFRRYGLWVWAYKMRLIGDGLKPMSSFFPLPKRLQRLNCDMARMQAKLWANL